MVQIWHPYTTIGKTIALTRRTFIGKVMPLLFNMLFMLIITFLPRSNCLLISWLHSLTTVIFKLPKIKSVHLSIYSPSICHEVMLGGIGVRRKRDDRGWDGWMASPTRCRWVWVNSGSWWWTGRPGVLQFLGLQRVGHDSVTEQQQQHLKKIILFIRR